MLPGNFKIFWLNMASALDSSFKTPSLAAHRLPLSDGIHQGTAWAAALGQYVALAAPRSWDGQHIAKQFEVSMAGEKTNHNNEALSKRQLTLFPTGAHDLPHEDFPIRTHLPSLDGPPLLSQEWGVAPKYLQAG
jgi:hypothetical protein